MFFRMVEKTEEASQVLDAFQQAPEPISTLYTGRLWCRPGAFVSAHRMKFHPWRRRKKQYSLATYIPTDAGEKGTARIPE